MATAKPVPPKKAAPRSGPPFAAKPLSKEEKRRREQLRKEKMAAVTFEAPEEMKTLTVQFFIRTMHDGTIHPQFKAQAIKGRWDNADARRFDMMVYDPLTAGAVVARIGAATFASNPSRRLPADSVFRITMAARSDKEGNVGLSVREIAFGQRREGKKMRYVPIERDPVAYKKKDEMQVAFARIRRASRLLRGAFVTAQPIPGIREYQQMEARLAGAASEE